MAKYQIQYKNNSKTHNDVIEANSIVEIKNIFEKLVNCEVTEIREILYENDFYPKDDGDYIKGVTVSLKDDFTTSYNFAIPKLRKTISKEELGNLIKSNLTCNSQPPKRVFLNGFF